MHCSAACKSHRRDSIIDIFGLLMLLFNLAVPGQELNTNLIGKPGEGYYIEVEIGLPPQIVC
ncbi:hypothetical protein Cfor_09932 [Coptotermes formosanus]|uniref:Uncharacterized protein n=1 Tax=Coptotermes formosanus TaxID=36987 RepID=A0A6L2PBS5_COPFO|nr:hypothetical protein Cfor_09932 [Coptotermes formosanus]